MPKQTLLNIKNYFNRKKASRKSKTTSYQSTNNIGILIQAKELKNTMAINTFVNELKSAGKNVNILCFNDNNSSLYFEFNFEEFSIKDINFGGNYLKTSITDFINTEFEYLICLSINPTPVLENILISSKAKCIAGLQTTKNESLFDLMIYSTDIDIAPDQIGSQIIDIVKKIK